MHIICTASHGPLAMIVDLSDGRIVRQVDMPKAIAVPGLRPFGIAKLGNGGWAIAANNAIVFLDKVLGVQDMVTNLPENIHQLAYDPKANTLWISATSIDSLLAMQLDDKSLRRFCLISDTWTAMDAAGGDTQHFNSLRWSGDLLYVVAHRFGQGSAFVRSYDRQMSRSLVWSGGRESHNICEYNGQLLLLDSRGGRIIGNQGLDIPVCGSMSYTRGMAISPEGIAVVAVFEFGNRESRTSGDAQLKTVDLNTGQLLDEWMLAGVGNIQDIQWWDEVT